MDSFELSPDTFGPGVITRPDHSPYHIPPKESEGDATVETPDASVSDDFQAAPAPQTSVRPVAQPQRTQTARQPQSQPRPFSRQPQPIRTSAYQQSQRRTTATRQQTQVQDPATIAAEAGKTRWFDMTGLNTAVKLFTGSRMVKFFGIVLTVLSGYLLISGISYFSNGDYDQSVVLHQTIEEAAQSPGQIGNIGGPVGAKVSHMLLAEMFGIASFILIYYLGAIGVTLVGWHRFRFWKLSFRCFISTVTISILLGFITYGMTMSYSLGGSHGYYINKLLLDHVGIWGAIAVNIVLVSALILIFLSELQSLYAIYRRRKDAYNEKMERKRAEIEARRIRAREELARSEAERTAREASAQPAQPPTVAISSDDSLYEESAVSDAVLADETANSISLNDSQSMAETDGSDTLLSHNSATMSPSSPNGGVGESSLQSETLSDFSDQHQPAPVSGQSPTPIPVETPYSPETNSPQQPAPTATQVGDDVVMTVQTTTIETVEDEELNEDSLSSRPDPRDQPLYDPTAELSKYEFPPLDLLHEGDLKTNMVDIREQESNKNQIISALKNYGIEISSITATVGPTITLYEIVPAQGVRIAQIKRLEDDIALTLRALGIRIIAPIPGKGTVGIEVPNNDPQIVPMRAILASKKFRDISMELPMAVGATISNDVFIADLARMPHLLVAGATGQGKSVGLNAILASLLYKKHPSELKLVLVDPKQLEFSLYGQIERHFLAKLPDEDKAIITDMTKVVPTLNSLCVEMENRYTLLTEAGVRGIKEYNQLFREHRLNPEKGHHFLPYIVVVIDEFADLIMTQGKEVENPISRIAAKARAAGIHMILATQRPSTNIITGIIKANFPGRMAFRVTQMVDSRTIIDRPGANQLIGRGDMLFSRDGVIDRVQCAFIDTDEVKAICSHIASQVGPEEAYLLPEFVAPGEGGGASAGSVGDRDPLFEDAGRTVIETGVGSTSNLQRKYNIGYPRAGKIMDQLEMAGVVGPTQGGKPRQVLMDSLSFERYLESQG